MPNVPPPDSFNVPAPKLERAVTAPNKESLIKLRVVLESEVEYAANRSSRGFAKLEPNHDYFRDKGGLTSDERLTRIAEILARGLQRLESKNATKRKPKP